MRNDRPAWVYRAACACLLIVAALLVARTWREWRIGQVDPVSAGIALVGLVSALWAGRQAVIAQRNTESDAGAWAERLAGLVESAESVQRTQLLAGRSQTIDVDFMLKSAPGHNARGAVAESSLGEVVDYYRRLRPQRLVITGVAGAGKTVLAVELILGLLAVREPGDPVPVRVSAAGWDPDIRVQDWLASDLVQTFRFPPAAAKALVQAGRILPVIDGLDEMDDDPAPGYRSRAANALKVLNAYQRGQEAAQVILTCRTGQYEALIDAEVWAEYAARVDLAPVTPDKAWQFIEAYAGEHNFSRWQSVLEALTDPMHVLTDALATPWRLTLAATVYQERDPSTGEYLRDPSSLTAFTSHEEVRSHLLGCYIPAVTRAVKTATGNAPYPPEKIHAWFGVLAGYLNTNTARPSFAGRSLSNTDLIPHELWPLAGHRPRHVASFIAALIALACNGLILSQASFASPLSYIIIASLLTLFSIATFVLLWRTRWPNPARIDPTLLRSSAGRRNFASMLGRGLVLGLVLGVVGGVVFGFAGGGAFASVGGFAGGFAGMLVLGLTTSNINHSMNPRDVLRADLTGWFVFELVFVVGLAVVVAFEGGPGGAATLRYLSFLICARKILPWRLGAFLYWSYGAGLLRVAGIAYQFRHRELQDYMAINPASIITIERTAPTLQDNTHSNRP